MSTRLTRRERFAFIASSLLLVAARPASVWADGRGGWDGTFVPEVAGTYLGGDRGLVLVVDVDAPGPAAALREALRASGRAQGVVAVAPLGRLAGLDDGAILARARRYPADLVAVVRLLPGTKRATATAAFYEQDGSVVSSFRVAQGALLAPAPHDVGKEDRPSFIDRPGDRPRDRAGDRVRDPASGKRAADAPDLAAARRSYERRRVGVLSWTLRGQRYWGDAYLGSERERLALDDFYRVVGHPGYARLHRRLHAARVSLLVAGTVLLAGGLVATLASGISAADHPFCRAQDARGHCIDADKTPDMAIFGPGVAALVVGAGLGIGGLAVSTSVTTRAQDQELANDYNRRLRDELGLPDAVDDADSADPPDRNVPDVPHVPDVRRVPRPRDRASAQTPRWVLSPRIDGRGAGMSFALGF